ncbi:TetR/AcrR family transcriptional regulator [Klenkia terrae]|uniref:Helix-turn-helix domain-containing protein n=1 Tax=Klenkia terrae TaxID=1052259 RepID=A0ABU8E886_9ACTN|nr:TetR/AcrR family transcriptional regulator [Klenkia terrae]SSC25249.1 transcriptional regulator, TetR family [Klenkia terrae]
MGRWAPDARGRLHQAAMELYTEHGYDGTTTADIAERAGLSERTYFRHFADKREVLFDSTDALQTLVLDGIAGADPAAAPLDAAAAGLGDGAALLQSFGQGPRHRAAVVAAHAELRERELAKMATLAQAVAGMLVARGSAEASAALTAETAVAVFRVAFDRWVADPDGPALPDVLAACFAELREVSARGR